MSASGFHICIHKYAQMCTHRETETYTAEEAERARYIVLSTNADHFFKLASSVNVYTSYIKLFCHRMLRVVFLEHALKSGS